eukprot:SAG31_NODE_4592_length_3107_cov_9.144729_2_plen_175_part_00
MALWNVSQELLRDLNKVAAPKRNVDYVVAAFSPAMFGAAASVTAALRAGGASVDLLPTHKKARWAFDYADRVGAARIAYVAPDEWADKQVTIKDLRVAEGAGTKQANVPIDELDNVDKFFGGTSATPGAIPGASEPQPEGPTSAGLPPEVSSELERAKERIAELTARVDKLEQS